MKLDDAILDNRKILAAGPEGLLLHVAAITWCGRNLTDGLIPKCRVPTLVAGLESLGTALPAPPAIGPDGDTFRSLDAYEIADHLAKVGLWHDQGECWEVHDYLVYNPTRAKVLADRERARTKKAKQRLSPDVSPGDNHTCPDHVPMSPVPVPVPGSRKEKLAIARQKKVATRATTWPDDFTLTEERASWGRDAGIEVAWEWNKFKDHALKDGVTHKNWNAAWRYWIRNAVDYAHRRRG